MIKNKTMDQIQEIANSAEERWGTKFDDKNTLNDWVTYAMIYMSRATVIDNIDNKDIQVDALLKAAGLLATAAQRIENGAMAPRHYDNDS